MSNYFKNIFFQLIWETRQEMLFGDVGIIPHKLRRILTYENKFNILASLNENISPDVIRRKLVMFAIRKQLIQREIT